MGEGENEAVSSRGVLGVSRKGAVGVTGGAIIEYDSAMAQLGDE